MNPTVEPLVVGVIVLGASLISLRLGLSVAILEILFGAIAGQFGFQPLDWMAYLASFGGIVLTFLAGTEIDTKLMREKSKESFLIGFLSFLFPFFGVAAYTYFVAHWNAQAALIAGTALSTTSLAVVYSVLVETGLSGTKIGNLLMASTFVTDMATALALSVLFFSRKFISGGAMYTTLLMSTGLTFGTIASLFGLTSGLIDQVQYSVLVGVVIASAVVPTFIAQKWFMPVHSEDLVELNGNGDPQNTKQNDAYRSRQ